MDTLDEPPDDLRVRLQWPGTAEPPTDHIAGVKPGDSGDESSEVTDAEVDYPTGEDEHPSRSGTGPSQTVSARQLVLAGRSDSLQAALASIALRIDALASTTSTFRNLVSDRLTDYAEQVGRLAASAASDLEDYRHLHERSLEQIRQSVGDTDDNLRKLGRTVTELAQRVGALVTAVRENGDAVDHLLSERDQISDNLVSSLNRVGDQVQAVLEQGLEDVTASGARIEDTLVELTEGRTAQAADRLDEIAEVMAEDRERQLSLWAQVEDGLTAWTDDRGRSQAAAARLEQAITAAAETHERGLGKLASRLEARLDQLAATRGGVAGDDLTATLTRLDARLKELTTDLVSGRDRQTAKALAELSGQIDGVAGMVAEARAERQPVEARLNRLARAAAPAPDLSEIHSRLDEMAEALAQFSPPDLGDLHLHLDELAQTISRQPPGPAGPPARPPGVDRELTALVERLERIIPALEGSVPARRGRLGEVAAASSADERQELLDRFEQLGEQLGGQIEALRRRIALRARPAGQELDAQAIEAIAEAVIARLSTTEPPALAPPTPPAPRPLGGPGGMVSGEQRRRGPAGR